MNENDNKHEHTNEAQNRTKIIEVPEHLRKLYETQTGHEVQTTYFREPGALVDTSNTVREFVGTLLKESKCTEAETIFEFDFSPKPYKIGPATGNAICNKRF